MKDISHIRNDLYEYYLEAANEILNGSFKHKLDFVKPELLAKKYCLRDAGLCGLQPL